MTTAPRLVTTHPARYHGGARPRTTHCVWHATAGASVESSLAWLNRPNARETGGVASYHYVIERDGTVHQHAPHDVVAYHAGVSAWPWPDGAALNSRSLGIAFANRQVAPGASGFERITAAQIDAAVALVAWLADTYPALRDPAAHIRHRDCAPTRRSDVTPETLDWEPFVQRLVLGWQQPAAAQAVADVRAAQRWSEAPAAIRVADRARGAIAEAREAMDATTRAVATLEALLLDLEAGD